MIMRPLTRTEFILGKNVAGISSNGADWKPTSKIDKYGKLIIPIFPGNTLSLGIVYLIADIIDKSYTRAPSPSVENIIMTAYPTLDVDLFPLLLAMLCPTHPFPTAVSSDVVLDERRMSHCSGVTRHLNSVVDPFKYSLCPAPLIYSRNVPRPCSLFFRDDSHEPSLVLFQIQALHFRFRKVTSSIALLPDLEPLRGLLCKNHGFHTVDE